MWHPNVTGMLQSRLVVQHRTSSLEDAFHVSHWNRHALMSKTKPISNHQGKVDVNDPLCSDPELWWCCLELDGGYIFPVNLDDVKCNRVGLTPYIGW